VRRLGAGRLIVAHDYRLVDRVRIELGSCPDSMAGYLDDAIGMLIPEEDDATA